MGIYIHPLFLKEFRRMRLDHYLQPSGLLILGIGSLLPLASACTTTTKNTQARRPNVIYVFPDQMRNSAMGFWGESPFKDSVRFTPDPVHTPNLNQFAKEAVVFTSAYSNCPLSSPHRGMLFTGKFTANSGVPLNCNSDRVCSSLPDTAICMSDIFSLAGYNCAYIGKLHLDMPLPNNPQQPGTYVESRIPAWDAYTPPEGRHGFDYWYSYGTYDVHKHPHYWDTDGERHEINEWSPMHETDKAIAYLHNEGNVRDTSKPFFMMVSYNPPHNPYSSLEDCLEEDYNLYKDKPLGELLIRPNADTTIAKAKSAPYYFGSVTGVDRAFGRLMAELKALGLDENTIVIFSSDHGETMCSQGVSDPKNSPFIESLNVPFMVRMPQTLTPRIESGLMLSTPDVMPTLLGLCGLEKQIPQAVEGRNYAGRLTGNDLSVPLRSGALYIKNTDGERDADGKIHSYFPLSRGIKTDRYTLAFTLDKKTGKLKEYHFYDDLKDPYQLNKLSIEDYPEVVNDLCRQMVPLLKEADDPWFHEQILSDKIPYNS